MTYFDRILNQGRILIGTGPGVTAAPSSSRPRPSPAVSTDPLMPAATTSSGSAVGDALSARSGAAVARVPARAETKHTEELPGPSRAAADHSMPGETEAPHLAPSSVRDGESGGTTPSVRAAVREAPDSSATRSPPAPVGDEPAGPVGGAAPRYTPVRVLGTTPPVSGPSVREAPTLAELRRWLAGAPAKASPVPAVVMAAEDQGSGIGGEAGRPRIVGRTVASGWPEQSVAALREPDPLNQAMDLVVSHATDAEVVAHAGARGASDDALCGRAADLRSEPLAVGWSPTGDQSPVASVGPLSRPPPLAISIGAIEVIVEAPEPAAPPAPRPVASPAPGGLGDGSRLQRHYLRI